MSGCAPSPAIPESYSVAAGVLALALALLVTSQAKASEPQEEARGRFDLHYLAPSECPLRQQFVQWTNEFYFGGDTVEPSPPAWLASPEELAGSVQVKLVEHESKYTAHLVMVDVAGECSTSRPAHTETTCADAARAMAYSLAQALKAPDCEAAPGPPVPSPPPPAPAPVAAKPETPPPTPPKPPAPAHPTPPNPLRGELGVVVGGVYPIAEDMAMGGGLLVGFRNPELGGSARLVVGYWNAGKVPLGYDLSAELWSLTLALCPMEISLGMGFSLPLCGTVEVGAVALSGLGTAVNDGNQQGDRANLYLWSSLGLAPRLRAQSGWLFAEVEPSLLFPLLRHPLYVHQPSSDVSEQRRTGQVGSAMVLKAHLNAGFVFP